MISFSIFLAVKIKIQAERNLTHVYYQPWTTGLSPIKKKKVFSVLRRDCGNLLKF